MSRSGFALLAVLWTLTLLGGAVAVGAAATRLGQRAAMNRIALARGRWAAEACLAIAASRAAREALADTGTVDLGRSVTCHWAVDHPDARLDANAAPRRALVTLAGAAGVPADSAEAFAAAVTAGRRVAPFSDVSQIADLPGAGAWVESLLSVDGSGRVDAGTAGREVLASLPGLSDEAVATLMRRRALGRPIHSFDELSGALSPAARTGLHARYAELVSLLRFGSTRLVVRAEGWVAANGPRPRATIEAVFERVPDRLALLRRRQR